MATPVVRIMARTDDRNLTRLKCSTTFDFSRNYRAATLAKSYDTNSQTRSGRSFSRRRKITIKIQSLQPSQIDRTKKWRGHRPQLGKEDAQPFKSTASLKAPQKRHSVYLDLMLTSLISIAGNLNNGAA
jgi:hypothetical protein